MRERDINSILCGITAVFLSESFEMGISIIL